MSAYITRWCSAHGEWDQDVDDPFGHPHSREEFREFAERMVREAGCDPADLDWENCVVTDAC